MALSIQRTALIIVFIKLFLTAVLFGVYSGGPVDLDDSTSSLRTYKSQTLERGKNIQDLFFEGSVDTSNNYIEKNIGDDKLAFEMSVWDALKMGVLSTFPESWINGKIDRIFFFALTIILNVITAMALFEIYQIGWGKKVT